MWRFATTATHRLTKPAIDFLLLKPDTPEMSRSKTLFEPSTRPNRVGLPRPTASLKGSDTLVRHRLLQVPARETWNCLAAANPRACILTSLGSEKISFLLFSKSCLRPGR